jgi:hypothetical protein
MREAGQMVAYEIPLGLSILIVVLCAGTLNLVDLSNLQSGGLHTWLIFRNPFTFAAFFVFFVASLASNKRAPFDLPESESELVAGYHTEYSGMRFSFFFFAEYAAMFVIGAVQATLFLGGWNDPLGLIGYFTHRFALSPPSLPGLLLLNAIATGIFVSKCLAIVFIQMWLRWTLPRPRIDQVLYVCIKVLLPAACVLLIGAAIWQCFLPDMPGIPWQDYSPFNPGTWSVPAPDAGYPPSRLATFITQSILALVGLAVFAATVSYVLAARFSGNRPVKRLGMAAAPVIGLLMIATACGADAPAAVPCTLDRATGTTIEDKQFMTGGYAVRWNFAANRLVYIQLNKCAPHAAHVGQTVLRESPVPLLPLPSIERAG